MPDLQSIEESQLAQARGAAYGLIAHGFRYPEKDDVAALADPGRWDGWPDVLRDINGRVRAALGNVRDAAKTVARRCGSKPLEMQHTYDDLFGHAVRGRCPAYEMEYGRNEIIRQASDLADVSGFYGAFGLEIAVGANGRPDHISAECEFMSALCFKEAHAHATGATANTEICVDAERVFLRDHLARWLPALAQHVKVADSNGFFGALARFADAFVDSECSQFDIHAGPSTLELREPDPVDDIQISCGTGGCGQDKSDQQFVPLGTETDNHQNR